MPKLPSILLVFALTLLFAPVGANHKSQSPEDKAIDLVKSRKEVKAWLALFKSPGNTSPKTGGSPVLAIDSHQGSVYKIHVFEDMPDHQATFNYYEVDLKTGKIIATFPESD